MRRDDAKDVRITSQVNKQCWQELKILAVRKETSLQLVIQDILEAAIQKMIKKKDVAIEE